MADKFSYSGGGAQNCVELSTGSAVRDSQHPDDAPLAFPSPEWNTFLRQVKTQGRWTSYVALAPGP